MKILLTEDDENLATGLLYSLRSEGMEAEWADSIAAALERIKDGFYDLALLDVMLPDGEGFELCRRLREEDAGLPVIFLTALEDESHVVQGFTEGANDYVVKPFRMGELIARIKANARKEGVAQGEKKLDDGRLCVWKGGERIDLSPSEYKLLKLLMERAGEAVSREEILARLWETEEAAIDTNAVSVYIRRLREKLDGETEKSCIRTLRGAGYVWEGWT